MLMVVCSLQLSAKGYSQAISLSLKDVPLTKVFTEIEKQSNYSFVYGKEQMTQTKGVTLSVSNANIETVLNLIFKDQPLTYTITDKYIAVKQRTGLPAAATTATPAATAAPQAALPPAGTTAAAASAASTSATAAAAGGNQPLVFIAREECWITVTEAGGKQLLRRSLKAGETVGLSGALPLSVVVGRASAVDVQVRGKPYDLKPVTRGGGVARFEVTS